MASFFIATIIFLKRKVNFHDIGMSPPYNLVPEILKHHEFMQNGCLQLSTINISVTI